MFFSKVNEVDVEKAKKIKTLRGDLYIKTYIDVDEGIIALEDFKPGSTVVWQFYHTEAHYVLRGKAKITYSLPPFFTEAKEIIVEAGDVYLIPTGADLKWEVISEEPYRHLCFLIPSPPGWSKRPKDFPKDLAEGISTFTE